MTAGSADSSIEIVTSKLGQASVMQMRGRVDHTNATVFLDALEREMGQLDTGQGLVLDLSALNFITSAGLRGLILANKKITAEGGKLAIAGLHGTVAEVFRVSRFDALFAITDTVEDASALV